MVKIGFIVEGDSEKLILESESFRNYLRANNIEFVDFIANAEGGGNLLPQNLDKYTQVLKDQGATRFIILTDLENDPCIEEAKKRISAPDTHKVVIARKAIEAWYLADETLMTKLLKKKFKHASPETTAQMPYSELKNAFLDHTGRGINTSKPLVAKRMIREGFTIENASKHENCPSAKYFLSKLHEIAKQ